MGKLRIGLMVDQHFKPSEGGSYSYYNLLLQGLNAFDFGEDIELVNVIFYHGEKPEHHFKKPTIFINNGYSYQLKDKFLKSATGQASQGVFKRNPLVSYISSLAIDRKKRRAEKFLKENNIHLIYYLKPDFHILNYPFIATHWDIAHKTLNGFPEVLLNGIAELREKYYQYTLPKASLILCESETGVRELNRYYAFNAAKVKMLPMFPGGIVDEVANSNATTATLEKYQVQPQQFFLYPAQFWPHKNHYTLIHAFAGFIKKTNNPHIKLLLCGSDKGNLTYIQQTITSLGLHHQILIPGFVTQSALHTFYTNAIALVMPTFLGPTNMPILEAACLYCPVLCSNLEGHKEMIGDSALYFDPASAGAITDAMVKVTDEAIRSKLISGAKLYADQSPFNLQNSLQVLKKILQEVKVYRQTWGIKE